MPQIDVVENMKKKPGKCLVCSTTPMKSDGTPKKAIDLNVDVDWGQNAYICEECTNVICELWGWVSEEDHDAVLAEHRQLNKDHTRLRERFKEQGADLKRVLAGKKVERKHKKKRKAKSS